MSQPQQPPKLKYDRSDPAAMAAYQKAYRQKNREHLAHIEKEWRSKNREKSRETVRVWTEKNRTVLRAKKREYYLANREKWKYSWVRRKRRITENPESYRAVQRAWVAKNKQKSLAIKRAYRARNRAALIDKKKAYDTLHPDKKCRYRIINRAKWLPKAIAWAAKRCALVAEAVGSFTGAEWLEVCERFGWTCPGCGKKKKLTKDHIVPITRGGSNDISNIQPLCKSCNCKKGNRLIICYLPWPSEKPMHENNHQINARP